MRNDTEQDAYVGVEWSNLAEKRVCENCLCLRFIGISAGHCLGGKH